MSLLSSQRFLAIYSGLLTLCFLAAAALVTYALRNPNFGIVTARRVNIVEPDGTVRLTLSNRADFPGAWYHKREYSRPDRREAAGLLFMSDEGSEQGGLIWGAGQVPDGSVQNHCHLSFDQYEENQVFALDAGQEGSKKFSRLSIIDQGNYSIEEKREANDRIDKLPEDQRDAAWREFFANHRHDVPRLSLGRSRDGSAGLEICDSAGKVRIRITVNSDDKPAMEILDGSGKVVQELSKSAN
jgi:hypothetical protein